MYCLTLKIISRIVPNYLSRYDCKRGIKFLKRFEKTAIRIPLSFNLQDYKVFYQYPHISKFSFQVRLRYYKPVFIAASTIPWIYFHYTKDLETKYLIGYLTGAFLYLLLSLYMAYIGKNLIGRMYLHKDSKDIVVSYVNNYGKRVNKAYMINDIEVIDHPNVLFKKFFKKVIAHKPYREFNLCTTKAVKVEHLIFETIFPNVI